MQPHGRNLHVAISELLSSSQMYILQFVCPVTPWGTQMHPGPALTAAKGSLSLSILLQSAYKVSDNSPCRYQHCKGQAGMLYMPVSPRLLQAAQALQLQPRRLSGLLNNMHTQHWSTRRQLQSPCSRTPEHEPQKGKPSCAHLAALLGRLGRRRLEELHDGALLAPGRWLLALQHAAGLLLQACGCRCQSWSGTHASHPSLLDARYQL